MTELYRNEFYHVRLIKDDEDTPYHIYHNEHDVCGMNKFDNFAQALIISEQFNQMLHNDTWKREMIRSAPVSIEDVEEFH